jgi:hypothetical protein
LSYAPEFRARCRCLVALTRSAGWPSDAVWGARLEREPGF